MTQAEHSRLESIKTVLRNENVREQVRPIIERVCAELGRKKDALMTWEPIPLTVFGCALPPGSDLRGFLCFARARTRAPNDIRIVISA